ncbi:MAG TPA: FAD-dependent oxidoreductase [Nitrospiria bacterium]|nr:FAD-dependent oxidoreductase [Nitrospiria bacterium]
MTTRVVVVGNGMAGIAAVEAMVGRPHPPRITVFGAEPYVNYNRILLSDVLAAAKSVQDIILNPREWYDRHGIDLYTGTSIASLDLANRAVVTQEGARVRYDRLLLATGSTPFLPVINGLDKPGVFTFRNIDDTEAMIQWAAAHRRGVVVGGGLLGLEAARGLTNRGMQVTVVHLAGHLMEQQLDAGAGALLRRRIEKMGIAVRPSCTVEAVLGEDAVAAVRLSTGEVIETDLVLITAGIRPNVQLARDAGLAVNRGVLVNDAMATSVDGVYAVGECVEHRGQTYGLVAPLIEQAKVAADAIVGEGRLRYEGSLTHATLKVAGIELTSMGQVTERSDADEVLLACDTGLETYKKLVIRDQRIVGAIFLGDSSGSHVIREKMTAGTDVSAERATLLAGGEAAPVSVVDLPDGATICNCNGVSKGDIMAAIQEQGCTSRQQIAECTRATTGCGTCAGLVDELVALLAPSPAQGATGAVKPPNKVEQLKKTKPGLDVLPDLSRYAKEGWEAITEDDVQRLKWYGVFLRTPTPGQFMLRVRVTNGIATALQFREFARIARESGRGFAELTTRQQVQLRWMTIDQVPAILDALAAVGLTTMQTGMDNIRNVMGCSVTGLAPTEVVDTASITRDLTGRFINNREFTDLPRKFNIVITGCRENCTHSESQDVAMTPASRTIDGETVWGFNVAVGGKQGSGGFTAATPLDLFVRPDDAVDVASAIILAFRDHGSRESRNKSRLAFLVQAWGAKRFRADIEQRVGRPLLRAGTDERNQRKKNTHIGVFRQKQAGLNYVGLAVPIGRLTTEQLDELARLAEEYGTGELRITPEQNVVLVNVPDRKLGALLADEPLLRDVPYNPSEIMRSLVACPGTDYCGLALIETKARALAIARSLEQKLSINKPVSIHWSGCPSGCGNHLMADIGLLGKRAKIGGRIVDAVDIFVGGRSGPRTEPGTKIMEDVPCDGLEVVLEGLARHVIRDKSVEVVHGDGGERERNGA